MSEASRLIDQHIAKYADWRGDVMAKLRAIIKKADPGLQEEWKWDTPVFTSNGNVCAIGAFKESVKLNFFKGASLPDPDHLFNGGLDAKASRSIDFGKGDQIKQEPLQELVRAAAAKNAGKH
jgi:hypothetical protein